MTERTTGLISAAHGLKVIIRYFVKSGEIENVPAGAFVSATAVTVAVASCPWLNDVYWIGTPPIPA